MRPRFSIILPTYNRRDTILRAVSSVQSQTFADWELLITDDGSADGTREVLPSNDPRIRIFSQPNRGVASARNHALQERRGELVAFLDSDDEWLPEHLALADAFFNSHPGEHLFLTEFWQDWSSGVRLRHYRVEIDEWFPAIARRIHSSTFASHGPAGDSYCHVYDLREPIGQWGLEIADRSGYPKAHHYRGNILDHWRWGWLMLLQSTVLSAEAAAAIGPFDESYSIASDYPWMAELCRRHQVNLISIPTVVKHEFGGAGRELVEEHLVWGRTAIRFYQDILRAFDELFWSREPHTSELTGLRAHWQLLLGKAAMQLGDRPQAVSNLRAAREGLGGFEAHALSLLASTVPHGGAARAIYRGWRSLAKVPYWTRARLSRRPAAGA